MVHPVPVRDLAKTHCDHIAAILNVHQVKPEIVEVVRFHYTEAFIHGFEHGRHDDADSVVIE
jgi:hypothetical protein